MNPVPTPRPVTCWPKKPTRAVLVVTVTTAGDTAFTT
jgi:hypothetical protein